MDRLAQVFARTRSENRAAFVAYLCAGDPDFDTSLALCQAALGAGARVVAGAGGGKVLDTARAAAAAHL